MKKIIVTFFVVLMAVSLGKIYAHEHHHDKDSVKMSATEIRADSAMQKEMAEHQQMEAINAFPNYHPLIVHFPIVLLIMAFVFQLISFFYFKKEFSWATFILLTLGVITAWLASNTFHADTGELRGKAAEIFAAHEQMASFTWWFALVALGAKIASHFFLKGKWWMESIVTLLLLSSAIFVSITGHHGAKLVYIQGIGPMGKYLESYRLPQKTSDSISEKSLVMKSGTENVADKPEAQEENHHVGEIGKGLHGGTIEEADPNHMEIVADGNDLVFYLLDGDAKPIDMRTVTGSVKIQYPKKTVTISLMEMDGKLIAMGAKNKQAFAAVCTLTKDSKSYSALFDSKKDLPANK